MRNTYTLRKNSNEEKKDMGKEEAESGRKLQSCRTQPNNNISQF